MPALAIVSPSPLRPTTSAVCPARSAAASPIASGAGAPSSPTRKSARSLAESMPTSVAASVLAPVGDERHGGRRAAKHMRRGDDETASPDDARGEDMAPAEHRDGRCADLVDERRHAVGVGAQRVGCAIGFGTAHATSLLQAMRCATLDRDRCRRIRRTAERTCPLGALARRLQGLPVAARRRRAFSTRPDRDGAVRRAAPSTRRAGGA